MAAYTQEQYLALAKGLNKDRLYCFIDVEEFRHKYGTGDELQRAVREEITNQLRAQGITPTEATLRRFVGQPSDNKGDNVNTVCSMANAMQNGATLDGDAKISRQGNQEIAMVYWAFPARSKEEFAAHFSGYNGQTPRAFLDGISLEDFKNEVILHEMGHATSRERNQENTGVSYETGRDGLLRNHRSELRAEIVGAMERMRKEGGPHSAQAFEDMRAENWFRNIRDMNSGARIQPYMEYYIFVQTQKVIDEAKANGRFNFTDEQIAQTSDKIMREEDQRLQASRINGDGGELEREGVRLGRIAEHAGHDLQTAITQGEFKPQDKELVRMLAAAHERITGQKIHGIEQDVGVAPPEGPPVSDSRTQTVLRQLNSVAGITGMTFVFKDGEIKAQLSKPQLDHFMALSPAQQAECGGSMPLELSNGWVIVGRNDANHALIPFKASEVNPADIQDYINKAQKTGTLMNSQAPAAPISDPRAQEVLRQLNSVAGTTGMTFVFKDGEIKSQLSKSQLDHFMALSPQQQAQCGGSMPLELKDGWVVVGRPDAGNALIPLKANEINPADIQDYINKAQRTGTLMNSQPPATPRKSAYIDLGNTSNGLADASPSVPQQSHQGDLAGLRLQNAVLPKEAVDQPSRDSVKNVASKVAAAGHTLNL